jgi:hypothetical protein
MKRRSHFSTGSTGFLAGLALAIFCCPGVSPAVGLGQTGGSAAPPPTVQAGHQATELRQNQPLYFVENRGQAEKAVKYYHTGPASSLWFSGKEIGLAALRCQGGPGHEAVVRLQPIGMSPRVALAGAKPQAGKINFCIGSDPAKWLRNLQTFGEVVYREAYPGTDLRFYGRGEQLEYDVILRPGADPARVKFCCRGVEALAVRPDGSLALRLPGGPELVQARPLVYQEIGGQRVIREGAYKVAKRRGTWTYSFAVGPYDPAYPLVIDPVLGYASYLGGTRSDEVRGIAVDPAGNVYLTGRTTSFNFPPLASGLNGNDDCFVTKIDVRGTLVYSTYLGGSFNDSLYDNEGGNGIAADGAGNAYVTGYTWSTDFPTVGAFQSTNAGGYDAFVARLDPAGVLVFSSYLGGRTMDIGGRVYDPSDPSRGGNAVAVDGSGNIYVVGYTDSGQFPVNDGAFQTGMKGSDDAFVAKISPAGTLLYCTFLGGSENDATAYNEGANGIAVDAAGNAYITGYTWSTDFPAGSTASYQSSNHGEYDGFVAKLNPTGTSLLYSSYIGGALSEEVFGIAVDQSGNIYLGGRTESADFPSPKGVQTSLSGSDDAFALKINGDGALAWSTFLGGSDNYPQYYNEGGTAISLDQSGNVYLAGFSWCTDFPTLSPVQSENQGSYDVFVTKIGPNGDQLFWSTYLGGASLDQASGIAVDGKGRVLVAGFTISPDFPLKSPFQTNLQGTRDGFVACLSQSGHIEAIINLLILEN